jgi:hypothetical protein
MRSVEKGKTGTGKKASGKRVRCNATSQCPAFASPSGSGYCSHHEQMVTPVGELVGNAAKFKCHGKDCLKPSALGMEFCKACAEERMNAAMDLDNGDYENLMTPEAYLDFMMSDRSAEKSHVEPPTQEKSNP